MASLPEDFRRRDGDSDERLNGESSQFAAGRTFQSCPTQVAYVDHSSHSESLTGTLSRDVIGEHSTPHAPYPEQPRQGRSQAPEDGKWVMWVGNMPPNAEESELHHFFSTCPEGCPPDPGADGQVESIFMMGYTACCFINFKTRHALQAALYRYNGLRLHPADPTCPAFLCRIRTADDIGKAGVNSQRGGGMHRKWVLTQNRTMVHICFMLNILTGSDFRNILSQDVSSTSRPRIRPVQHQSEADSDPELERSTSSFLLEHFPTRYFILKSHSEACFRSEPYFQVFNTFYIVRMLWR
jgi:hypothetical protein